MPQESRGKLIFVTGGARSGKSSFAEALAAKLGTRVTYVATATPGDDEMRERIRLHRERRSLDWLTIEEPKDVARVVSEEGGMMDVILIDCLTLLVSNLLLAGESPTSDDEILAEVRELARVSREVRAHVIVVSNEVGCGIVPEYPLGRRYRDLLGRANQVVASFADEIYLCISGIPVELGSIGQKVKEGYGIQVGFNDGLKSTETSNSSMIQEAPGGRRDAAMRKAPIPGESRQAI